MIIDAHVHHMPIEVYKQFQDPDAPPKKCYVNGNDFTLSPKLFRTDDQLRAMDFAGVDMAVLALAQWNVAGAKTCRMINEGMANHVAKYKDRFRACASIPVAETEAAVQEVEYAVKELKLSGIALLTSQSKELTPSNKEHMWPIYAKAAEFDIPILFHPHLLPYGTDTDCTINRVVGRGFDISRTVLRMIYDVLPEFPNLKVIIPHNGGGFLAHKQRAIAFFEPKTDLGVPVPSDLKPMPKTPLETEDFLYKPAFDEMFNKLYIDGAGSAGWEPIMRMAFSVVRPDRYVFGTDWPFEVHAGRDLKFYLDNVRRMDISEEHRKAFLGGNLARLLKLEKQAAAQAGS